MGIGVILGYRGKGHGEEGEGGGGVLRGVVGCSGKEGGEGVKGRGGIQVGGGKGLLVSVEGEFEAIRVEKGENALSLSIFVWRAVLCSESGVQCICSIILIHLSNRVEYMRRLTSNMH